MFKTIGKMALMKVVPQLIDSAIDAVKDWWEDAPKEQPSVVTARKLHDTTKFTKKHFDAIMDGYSDLQEYNRNHPKAKKTTEELAVRLNETLGLNKSRTSYSRIWNGHVQRKDLPDY